MKELRKNAIIMAAGLSTRFVPLSLEMPKALLSVRGEIIIERQIRQLKEAGIKEIVIIVGHLKDKFYYLQEKFGVIIVESPDYRVKNNHSSLYVARGYLRDTFICSGDNYFSENVFLDSAASSYYASVFVAGDTKEWCVKTEKNGKIIQVNIGGKDSWIMKGHAYFTRDFSKQMVPLLENAYRDEKQHDKFWEEIYIEHIETMDMFLKKYEDGIIEEFDSIEELRLFDDSYKECTGSKVLKEICCRLKCTEADITAILPIKVDGEVIGFEFQLADNMYVYWFETKALSLKTKGGKENV